MRNKTAKIKIFLLAGLAFGSICAIIFYILYCTRAFFHSDMASYVLLAKEQMAKKQFFPDNFCYSTGIFIFTAELFVVPFMRFISDWVLCREIAVIILNILLFVLIFIFFKIVNSIEKVKLAPWVAVILWCVPMLHYDETIYEAAYIPLVIYELLMMMAFQMIICDDYKKKKIYYPALFFAVFIANIEGIRNLVILVFPLVVAIIIYLFIENFKNLDNFFEDKKYFLIIGIMSFAAVCAVLVFHMLSIKVGLASGTAGINFISAGEIPESFKNLIMGILQFYGAVGGGSLLSISGIVACINFTVMVICSIVVPVCLLVFYKKINSPFWKIYTLYCWISNFIVIYMMIFSTAGAIRYYYTVFWHNLLLTALVFGYLIEKSHKYISVFLVAAMIVVCGAGHFHYLTDTVYRIHGIYAEDKAEGTIAEYLEANGLNYGFASYWNAYKNMVLSDGRVMIAAWMNNPNEPFYWLTSKEWYSIEEHPGRCFLLVAPEEYVHEEYYKQASEIKYFRDYTILIFEKHLYLYDELNNLSSRKEPVVSAEQPVYSIPLDILSLGNNSYRTETEIGIKQEGMQFGSYIMLEEGTYQLEIKGKNLLNLQTELKADMGKTEFELEEVERTDDTVVYAFVLTKASTDVEIINSNFTETDIIITNINVSR